MNNELKIKELIMDLKDLYNQFKDKTILIDKMKNINILQSNKEYANMPYLETEEEAAEKIAKIQIQIKIQIKIWH